MALQSGLNAAIINPNSEAMMRAYYCYRALANLDPQCGDYIGIDSGQSAGLGETVKKKAADKEAKEGRSNGLFDAVLRGFREEAGRFAFDLLSEKQPLEIINEVMIPALDVVGKGFEKGTIFLPQLLMSAEAAGVAFEVLKTEMLKNGQTQEKKGKSNFSYRQRRYSRYWQKHCESIVGKLRLPGFGFGKGCGAGSNCRLRSEGTGSGGRLKRLNDHYGA